MSVTNRLCPNCFHELNGAAVCEKCGYDHMSRINSMALKDNTVLNQRYLIGRVLGSGGFGITYKAYDLKKDTVCAIKEYVPNFLVYRDTDGQSLMISSSDMSYQFNHGKKRFMEEANILHSLNYVPAVVKIFDYFDANNTSYFTMEYIEGITLSEYRRKKGGRIAYDELADIFIECAECLDAVHKKAGIFHRDVSPENILVRPDGSARMIDFGNAKYISSRQNQSLSVVLKPGFAPPEQFDSRGDQGSYTDVYSLAATFYLCLTGTMVPSASSRIYGDNLKPIDYYLGSTYTELGAIFDHALKLKVAERTRTAGEIIEALHSFNRRNGIKTRSEETKTISQAPSGQTGRNCYPYLEGIYGSVKGYRYKFLPNVPVSVGRGQECLIQLRDISVISKLHFDLFYDNAEDRFFLEDHSKNGTHINGQRCELGRLYCFEKGSQISLAQNAAVFRLGVIHE